MISKNLVKYIERYWYLGLAVIILVHLLILTQLIFFPYPELFIYSYLTKAGLIPYKEIFDQHFPGIMFFPVNLATLGIDTVEKIRLLHLAVVALTQILILLTAKKLFKSNVIALLCCLIFIPWQIFLEGYVLWIDSFIPLFLLPAFLLLNGDKSTKRYFFVGLLLGSALLFKQVVGPLIFLLVIFTYLKYRNFKVLLPLLGGLLFPLAVLIVWVTRLGIWKDFFYWTVSFNLGIFAQMGRKNVTLSEIIKITPLLGLGLVSLFYSLRKNLKKHLLLALFFLSSSAFIFARFDFIHLQPVIPFAIFSLISDLQLLKMIKAEHLLSLFFLFSVLFLVRPITNLVGEEVLFFTDQEKTVSQKVLKNANSGDTIFSIGAVPHIYQLTNTLPPGKIFVFQFPWFMQKAQDTIYNSLVQDSPKVIIVDKTVTVAGVKITDFMPKVVEFTDRYYQVVDNVGHVEIMTKR